MRRYGRSCSRDERVPCGLRSSGYRRSPQRSRRPKEDLVPARKEVIRKRRILPAYDDRPRHRSVQVRAKDELAQEHQRLRGLPQRHEMSRAIEEDIREPALLVDDAGELPVVIEPRRRRLAREALGAAKGYVLDDDLRAAVLDERVIVARVEDDRDVPRGRVRGEVGEEGDGLDARVAVLVTTGAIVHRPEGVVEVPDPVLGRGRMESGACAVVVEEAGCVLEGFGVRTVGNIIDVEAAIRCVAWTKRKRQLRWSCHMRREVGVDTYTRGM